jgi:hypothetical protein
MFLPSSFQRDSLPNLRDCKLTTYASELCNVGIAAGCKLQILELKLWCENLHPLVLFFLLYPRNEYNGQRLDQTSILFAPRRGGGRGGGSAMSDQMHKTDCDAVCLVAAVPKD